MDDVREEGAWLVAFGTLSSACRGLLAAIACGGEAELCCC